MIYYISTSRAGTFDDISARAKAALKTKGFGILTEIDSLATFQPKTGKAFRPYTILGTCNPDLAFSALELEDMIVLMLPCNVIVQDTGHEIEIAAIDPVLSIGSVGGENLCDTAERVKEKLQRARSLLYSFFEAA